MPGLRACNKELVLAQDRKHACVLVKPRFGLQKRQRVAIQFKGEPVRELE